MRTMRVGVALLLLTVTGFAQTTAAPEQLATLRQQFEPRPGRALNCTVTPVQPRMNFAFRVRAGYTLHVPWDQSHSPQQLWTVLTTVTPQDGHGPPVSLMAVYAAASAIRTDSGFDLPGYFLLGAGRYAVETALHDSENRVCRKELDLVVKSPAGSRQVTPALAPGAVLPVSLQSFPEPHLPDAPLVRMTVLINAASGSARRTTMRSDDRAVLLGSLTALVERVPSTSVRLVVFSLEQQREIYRDDHFSLDGLKRVADAMDAVPLSTVDMRVLLRPAGYIDLLASLIKGEIDAPSPADCVVFLGPASRYGARLPPSALPSAAGKNMRFYYVRYEGPGRRAMPSGNSESIPVQSGRGGGGGAPRNPPNPSDPSAVTNPPPPPRPSSPTVEGGDSSLPGDGSLPSGGGGSGGSTGGRGRSRGVPIPPPAPVATIPATDVIDSAVARLKGKTLAIHSPSDLAKAIKRIGAR